MKICKTSSSAFSLLLLVSLVSACVQQDAPLPELPDVSFDGLELPVETHLRSELGNVRSNPTDASANSRLAMALHTYRLYDAANVAYQRAQRISPDSFELRYLRGVVLQSMSKNNDAIIELRAADAMRPGYMPLRMRIAELSVSIGEPEAGAAIYRDLIAAEPALVPAHYNLGKVLRQLGDTSAAKRQFEETIRLKPDLGGAHYSLAEVLRGEGDQEGAQYHLKMFEKFQDVNAEIRDPVLMSVGLLNRTAKGLQNAALVALQRRDPQKAAAIFEEMIANSPDSYSAHINLIGLYGDLGQHEKSEEHFEVAYRLRPEDPKLHNNHGVALLRARKLDRAEASFAEAVRLNPDYAGAWKKLGKVQQDLGKESLALESYRKAMNLNAGDRQAKYFYGRLLIETGSPAQAIEPLTAALKPKDRTTPHYMRYLGIAQAGSGDLAVAITTLKSARALARNTGQDDLVRQIDSNLKEFEDK